MKTGDIMNDLEFLKEEIKNKLDNYRYLHVISVYEECAKLADIFKLSKNQKHDLLISALLHDITKGYDKHGQIALAKELGITLKKDNLLSPKTLHAVTGEAYAKKYYPDLVKSNICRYIRYHTTGRANMSLGEKLLYLADYIEPTRKFDDCIQVRERFYGALSKGKSSFWSLDDAILFSLDLTLKQLIEENAVIHPDTVKSRNYLLRTIDYSSK